MSIKDQNFNDNVRLGISANNKLTIQVNNSSVKETQIPIQKVQAIAIDEFNNKLQDYINKYNPFANQTVINSYYEQYYEPLIGLEPYGHGNNINRQLTIDFNNLKKDLLAKEFNNQDVKVQANQNMFKNGTMYNYTLSSIGEALDAYQLYYDTNTKSVNMGIVNGIYGIKPSVIKFVKTNIKTNWYNENSWQTNDNVNDQPNNNQKPSTPTDNPSTSEPVIDNYQLGDLYAVNKTYNPNKALESKLDKKSFDYLADGYAKQWAYTTYFYGNAFKKLIMDSNPNNDMKVRFSGIDVNISIKDYILTFDYIATGHVNINSKNKHFTAIFELTETYNLAKNAQNKYDYNSDTLIDLGFKNPTISNRKSNNSLDGLTSNINSWYSVGQFYNGKTDKVSDGAHPCVIINDVGYMLNSNNTYEVIQYLKPKSGELTFDPITYRNNEYKIGKFSNMLFIPDVLQNITKISFPETVESIMIYDVYDKNPNNILKTVKEIKYPTNIESFDVNKKVVSTTTEGNFTINHY